MKKKCNHCGTLFECNVNAIQHCSCTTIQLTKKQLKKVKENYNDCLCPTCLKQFANDTLSK